jgi:trans-2-enoyl-CoA reductase
MRTESVVRLFRRRCIRRPNDIFRISTTTTKRTYHEISFSSSGDPTNALTYRKHDGFPLAPSQIGREGSSNFMCRVDMLHAPWNPADALTVQGRYGSPYADQDAKRDALRQSPFHEGYTVAGSEGFGRVVEIVLTTPSSITNNENESNNENLIRVGDWVTVGQPGLGTMRSSMWVPTNSLIRADRGQELWERAGPQASTLFQLGGTALRMLRDFVDLQPGEIVLQNAGNSSVGFMASQLARLRLGVSVVSLARKGSKTTTQWNELVQHLTKNGKCRLVVAEEDLQDRKGLSAFQSQLEQLGNGNLPRLALNTVGGSSASLLLSSLAQGGTMVTYGGMSLQPVTISTAHLIFKDLRLHGYWHSRWMVQCSYSERHDMVNELVQTLLDDTLTCPPVQVFPLAKVRQAMEWESTQQSSLAIRRKLVWDCQES